MRIAILIVVTMPILAPPGFCLCRAGRVTKWIADHIAPTAVASQDDGEPTCECPNCRQRPATPADPASDDPSPDSNPVPDHCPACPAHPTYAITRASAIDAPTKIDHGFVLDLTSEPQVAFERQFSSRNPRAIEPPPREAAIILLTCSFRC